MLIKFEFSIQSHSPICFCYHNNNRHKTVATSLFGTISLFSLCHPIVDEVIYLPTKLFGINSAHSRLFKPPNELNLSLSNSAINADKLLSSKVRNLYETISMQTSPLFCRKLSYRCEPSFQWNSNYERRSWKIGVICMWMPGFCSYRSFLTFFPIRQSLDCSHFDVKTFGFFGGQVQAIHTCLHVIGN